MYPSSNLSSFPLWTDLPNRKYPVLHLGLLKGDNFGYFLQTGPAEVLAVDVPEGRGMLDILEAKKWTLTTLLLTHTHHDHVVHLEALLQKTGCAFYHPEGAKVPARGRGLADGEGIEVNGFQVQALDTSGHSELDYSYWFPELELCFCGDSLFAFGCGRMFAGPPERFWHSLERLRRLPDTTRICCGHDYLSDNLRFVRQTFPGLREMWVDADEVAMPLLLGDQKAGNPFLMADDPRIAAALGLDGENPAAVFKKARERRNQL